MFAFESPIPTQLINCGDVVYPEPNITTQQVIPTRIYSISSSINQSAVIGINNNTNDVQYFIFDTYYGQIVEYKDSDCEWKNNCDRQELYINIPPWETLIFLQYSLVHMIMDVACYMIIYKQWNVDNPSQIMKHYQTRHIITLRLSESQRVSFDTCESEEIMNLSCMI